MRQRPRCIVLLFQMVPKFWAIELPSLLRFRDGHFQVVAPREALAEHEQTTTVSCHSVTVRQRVHYKADWTDHTRSDGLRYKIERAPFLNCSVTMITTK